MIRTARNRTACITVRFYGNDGGSAIRYPRAQGPRRPLRRPSPPRSPRYSSAGSRTCRSRSRDSERSGRAGRSAARPRPPRESRRRFHGVGPRVDHTHAQLLAAERHEVAGAIGRVFEDELRDFHALQVRRQRVVAAGGQRRFIRLQLPRHTCTPVRTPWNALDTRLTSDAASSSSSAGSPRDASAAHMNVRVSRGQTPIRSTRAHRIERSRPPRRRARRAPLAAPPRRPLRAPP